ncbi:Imm26 family immunity protein [Pseudomonas sp. KNUC1026]|uniref:Imm26 family immunity protein n=1 Tax=Pseudomonas sp. KNUC1026 TaxID=2893890 RepID=UPI001F180FA1|nr:Imm26 family immunity protein [Pseudomonas sp. KNUC1026]UFH50452.1 immunity 26/phosphotriesterase HocA family protein [Pseudomonas sp. KNUC1026]
MQINFSDWNKKPKTLLRYIKPGDIFCFLSGENRYHFGRVMTRNRLGHVAEVFRDHLSIPDASRLPAFERLWQPLILDSYSLFDRKLEGDWRIVGHQPGYSPDGTDDIFFTLGVEGSCKRVDIFDNEVPITREEAKTLRDYSPMGDFDVKEALGL